MNKKKFKKKERLFISQTATHALKIERVEKFLIKNLLEFVMMKIKPNICKKILKKVKKNLMRFYQAYF